MLTRVRNVQPVRRPLQPAKAAAMRTRPRATKTAGMCTAPRATKAAAMCTAPRAETRPSSPIPPFLLAQNQFSNRIASTEHAAKVRHAMWHHRWLRRLNGGNHNLEEGRLWQKDNQIVDFTAPMIKVINGS